MGLIVSNAVIYIQILHDLPRCIWSSVKKVRELWDGDIYIMAPARERDYPGFEKYNVKFIEKELFNDEILDEYSRLTFLDYDGWNGFWDTACKRFFYQYLLQKKFEISGSIQIETDVVPYMDINSMFGFFHRVYAGKLVFIPYGDYQLNCSFTYCDRLGTLKIFCDKILEYFKLGLKYFPSVYPGQVLVNETHFNFKFSQDHPELVDTFPSLPDDKNFDKLGFLIDPHAWGMWLDGRQRIPGIQCAVDTQIIGRKILAGEYDIHFLMKDGRVKRPFVHEINTKRSYPLATLHFNSKRSELWI
jgi:hypothetical protein